jgi:hypothetical protein
MFCFTAREAVAVFLFGALALGFLITSAIILTAWVRLARVKIKCRYR